MIPPHDSFHTGIDDLLRLVAFNAVALAMAYVSSARKRAEDTARTSLAALEIAVDIVRTVSGWPVLIGPDRAAGARKMLGHAGAIVGATEVAVMWEAFQDQPAPVEFTRSTH